MPQVLAEVSVSQLSPFEGPVGAVVSLKGQISTANGSYRIFFANYTEPVKSGNATQFNVTASFTVLNATFGNHPVTLQDVTTGENSTSYFKVQTGYLVKAVVPQYPRQLQENSNTTLLVITTGGNATTALNVTTNVKNPANTTYSSNITIPIGSNGYGIVNVTYPTDFGDAHTFYVGTYEFSLNLSNEILATGSFTIGLTDAVEYYRFQTVHVKAVNYTANDVVKVTITHNGVKVFESIPRNASVPGGVVTANWTIPANASIGLYRVNVTRITSSGPNKPIADNQTFAIIEKSFACEVKAFNLDNELVEGIIIEARNMTSLVATNKTGKDGVASFFLSATNYNFTAFLNNSQVGAIDWFSLSGNLTGASAFNISCPLAHIKVLVKDADDNVLPFIDISANFTYTIRTNTTIAGKVSAETDLNGIAVLRNLFTNISYTVKASRYEVPFVTTQMNLTSTSWFNTTCPKRQLIVKIYDRDGDPLQNAQVNATDWGLGGMSAPIGTDNTGTTGIVSFNFTFGKYTLKIYREGILLNHTSILLTTQPTNFSVYCRLYKLTLNVNVLDYFGQGISSAKVTLEREGAVLSSLNTAGNGMVQFNEIIGGDYRILVYLGDKPYGITLLYLQESQTINLRIAELVSVGGLITETSVFVSTLLIVFLVLAFVVLIFYRKRKLAPEKE